MDTNCCGSGGLAVRDITSTAGNEYAGQAEKTHASMGKPSNVTNETKQESGTLDTSL